MLLKNQSDTYTPAQGFVFRDYTSVNITPADNWTVAVLTLASVTLQRTMTTRR